MTNEDIIGIDLGGTQLRAAITTGNQIHQIYSDRIPSSGTMEEVLAVLYHLIDPLVTKSVKAIGIGVPSVVDLEKGIVYDVQNIPSWKEVPLKNLMEDRYHIPVLVNNDANCFALGEKYFGYGQMAHSMIGLTIGTGLGAGIIINDKLYPGVNCGAGEFGNVAYLDQCYEYYASGQFFQNCYHERGEFIYQRAINGDAKAIEIFNEFGRHLGNAIKMILYTYCPELIIFGGSISKSFSVFQEAMWERIRTYVYSNTLNQFTIKVSGLANSGVLGAAALYYDQKRK
jgi:glucokinase